MDEEKDQHITAAPVTSESVDLEEDKKLWQMPEPVFRQSTGHLPKGFQKQFPGSEDETVEPIPPAASDSNGAAEAAAAEPTAALQTASDIQPQPDILEDVLAVPSTPVAAAAERSKGTRIFLAVVGILAMVVFAVAFVAVIYYLFFYHPAGSNGLN